MANPPPTGNPGSTTRVSRPSVVVDPPDERLADDEQRVAITLGVGDGFKFGCGFILAGIAFYFALIIVVGAAFLVATILNLPIPFGPGH